MKKYIEIAKILFKAQLTWRFDIAFNMLFTITKILFAYILWGAIFGEQNEIAGFSFNTLLTYYIISSFLSGLDMSERISGEISAHIRDGSFSKYMVLPVKIIRHFGAQTVGTTSFYMLFNILAAVVWVFIFKIQFAITSNVGTILSAILIVILGLVFMVQLSFFLGILTFKFQDIWIFLMIKGTFVAFITGTMIPLVLLPQGIVSVMRFFPFYYVTYLPSMLFVGRNQNEIGVGFITLFIWVLIFIPINQLTYNRLRIKYDGVGI
ncbi:MAG: ABC-2 family transporter protein [Vallitaleaceae bacterium]|nr:ABC-2 family transporter protein [Vallitaleaceae bacterium]